MNYKIPHSHQSDLFLKGFKIDSLGYVCLIWNNNNNDIIIIIIIIIINSQ